MKYLLLLLLASTAKAAPLVQPQDVSFSTFTFGGLSVATTTIPTTKGLMVYGVITSSTVTPTVACNAGTGVMISPSSSQAGSFTAGTLAVNCTVTFAQPFPQTPTCFCISNAGTPLALSVTPATTSVKCTSASALTGDTLYYFCWSAP